LGSPNTCWATSRAIATSKPSTSFVSGSRKPNNGWSYFTPTTSRPRSLIGPRAVTGLPLGTALPLAAALPLALAAPLAEALGLAAPLAELLADGLTLLPVDAAGSSDAELLADGLALAAALPVAPLADGLAAPLLVLPDGVWPHAASTRPNTSTSVTINLRYIVVFLLWGIRAAILNVDPLVCQSQGDAVRGRGGDTVKGMG
jgi:hypothetical protein